MRNKYLIKSYKDIKDIFKYYNFLYILEIIYLK